MGKILTRDRQSPPHQDPINPLAGVQSQESFTLTLEILAHPIFECAEDPILSTIIESLKCLARPEVDNLGLQTQNQIFSTCLHDTLSVTRNDPDVFANLRRIDQTNATICQKMIAPNGFFFRCLDCENTEDALTISTQCHKCFKEARHEGHRIVKVVSGGAVYICDCGRLESIKEEGFCPRHKHKEQTVEEALVDFPTMLRYKFTDAVKKTIYGIVSLLEIKQKATNKKSKVAINLLAATYYEGLIHFYVYLTGRISRSFTLVLEKVLKLSFDEPYGLVWHDCTDMKDETHIKKIQFGQPSQCNCTLLGCIMRFSKDIPEQIQIELCKILVECFKEKESIDYLHRQIIKHSYFIFGNPGTSDRLGKRNNSRLCQMLPKTLSLQESELEYIDYMLELLRTIIEDCSIINNNKCNAVQTIKTGIALFLNTKTKASDKALQETGLMKKLLELLSRFQVVSFYRGEIKLGIFEHTVEYTNLSDRLGVEALLCMSLDCGLKRLGDLAEDKRDPFFKEFATAWYENFQGKKPMIDHYRLFKRRINPHSGMEKVLCLMIIHYLQEDISKDSLDGFFRKFFPDIYPSILASNAVKETLTTLGLMRFTDILRTVDTNTKYNYHLPTYLYEMDVVFIQLMTLFIRPEDLFSLFTRSFFSYSQEIIDICLSFITPQAIHDHPHSRHIILALEDFLEFFVYMMNDEICLMNLNLRDKLSRIRPGFPPERVIRKLFVNILHEGRWINVGFIKDIASMFMCENVHAPVDSVISKLVLRDDQTHMIKLKREYNSELDPYIFYKHYHSSRSNRNFLAREETVSSGIDVVSGIFYTDLPEYLTAIQYNIFQSQLPDFVCHLINNFCKGISRLLQPALRLVLFNLQVVNESLKSPTSSTEPLQKKVEANYLNNTFINSLNKILGQSDYKDCEPCIRKIQSFIKDLSSKLTVSEPSMSQNLVEQIEEVKVDPMDEKKRQAKLKMEKLKEEFAKKQTRFAEKNESFLTQINVSPDPKRSDNDTKDSKGHVCQYCLAQIDDSSSEEYGVPIFIEFTNNFYDADKQTNLFLAEQYHDLSITNWWPVISSCNHFYHRKCFDLHVQSSRGPQNLSSQFFMNECEVQCALCRKLFNNFLVMNKEPDFEKFSQYSSDFILKLQYLLTNFKERLLTFENQGNQVHQFGISRADLFGRSYEYFIESFYLHEKPQIFIESFELYLKFLKVFKDAPQNEITELPEKISLFKHIPQRQSNWLVQRLILEPIANKLSFILLNQQIINLSSMEDHLNMIKELMLCHLVYLAGCEEHNNNDPIQLKDIPILYKNRESKDKTASELLFPLQRIALGYFLNNCVLNSIEESARAEFCSVLLSSGDSSEKLDIILQKSGISSSFEALIESSFLLLDNLSENEVELLGSRLNPQSQYPDLVIKTSKLAPKYVQLPNTYMEYSLKYTRKKCSNCYDYPRANDFLMCLICGECMCISNCNGRPIKVPGNASRHAAKYHMGLGLFFAIDILTLIEVKWPFNMIYFPGPSYVNELGESIIDILKKPNLIKNADFSKFVLDKKLAEKIKNMIVHHSVGQEIFDQAPNNVHNIFNDLRM